MELRYACLRWRRGIWGACNGIVCPGCHLPFRPSHASKCNLLPPGAGNINSSDISAMKSQWEKDGISKDIRNMFVSGNFVVAMLHRVRMNIDSFVVVNFIYLKTSIQMNIKNNLKIICIH